MSKMPMGRLCLMSVLVGALGCGTGGEGAGGVMILPHVWLEEDSKEKPVSFPDFYPEKDGEVDVATLDRTPYEWVLLLRSEGGETLTINKVCLIGDGANQFSLEGPTETTVEPGRESAVRLTYARKGKGGVDNVAVVVQSNAENYPTLVVPMCARVVDDGAEKSLPDCTPPAPVMAGMKDEALCP